MLTLWPGFFSQALLRSDDDLEGGGLKRRLSNDGVPLLVMGSKAAV